MRGKAMDGYNIFSLIAGGISAVFSSVMDNPISQWIIFGLSVALIVANLISTIISAIKKAKSDGKITLDEIKDIADESKEAIEDGLDKLKGTDKEEKE